MPVENVPFSFPDIGAGEIDAVVQCLRSGWLTTGSRSEGFERDFAEFLGGGVTAVAVSSATAGLEIALAVNGIGPGDEVITSDYTFTATAMCVVHAGARPVLVDIDPATLNIDPAKIEAAITPRTKAIIPVHFAGLPCDMAAISSLARRHGLKVIEDAAHALPSKIDNRMIGQGTSDASVFSFYASKTLTTGEGGMMTFADPDLAKQARTLRLHGINKDIFSRAGNGRGWHYDVVAPGFKSNMSDIAAAIGAVQLRRAWDLHARRQELWTAYNRAFAGLPILPPPAGAPHDVHAMHLYAIRLRPDAPCDRDSFVSAMAEAGIGCSVHFIPLHMHSYWRETLKPDESMFPEARRAFAAEVSLPIFSAMTDDMQRSVIDNVRRLLS